MIGRAASLAPRTDRSARVEAHQRLRLEILDDGVLTDRQVVLVAAEDQAVVYRVTHQVDAGAHDEGDDADIDHGARQGAWGPLDELRSEGGPTA